MNEISCQQKPAMKCAIMQPTYLPWCGYFNLIDSVDVFIVLDDVQLEKRNWQIRNRIKSPDGELMLSVSVNCPHGRENTMINQAELDLTRPWQRKHLKSIYTNYRKTEFFDLIYPFIESHVQAQHHLLSDFTVAIIKAISQKLEIKSEFIHSSHMADSDKTKDQRLAQLCQSVGANHYISPIGAARYIDRESAGGAITKNGITLDYQQFEHPVYHQLYGDFISHLSIIDMLFNCGFERTAQLIRQ